MINITGIIMIETTGTNSWHLNLYVPVLIWK